jgi:membrane protein implicated in regulation of membrane protease activity
MAVPRTGRTRVAIWIVIGVLLTAALIGTLWVPFYNHLTPALGGFPFFYWYQLMWVPIAAILSGIAYLLSRLAQRDNAPPETTTGGAQATEASTGRDDVT